MPALASPPTPGAAAAAPDSGPPSAVEDFAYPGATQILRDKGIKLVRGDGHLLLADCNDNKPQIKVMTKADASVGRAGQYCFQATAKTGYLTLEVPRVFYLQTADHPISADLSADGQKKTVDLSKDDFKSVGEGDILSGGKRSVLVELRVTG
ncbi:hypothetical protein ACMATS_22370 [Streptoverticillium reticulum]|uniref:hypothetical protein n=1 Tax=Streptoverticillium reticulum TaxID=1433415 RepID=UPI0039BF9EB0